MLRILVIKHGALGDIMQGLDAFASLRAFYDRAHISVLTSPSFAGLMKEMPYFDEVITDSRAPFWQVTEHLRLKRIIKSGFDIIIDLQCSARTARYHKFLAPSGQRWLGTAKGCSDPYPDFSQTNNRDRMLQAAIMLGAPVMSGDLSFLAAQAPYPQDDLPDSYAILMPGCSPAKPSKRWPARHYAALADLLADNGVMPVLVGTALDAEACHQIAAHCPKALNLCGKTSLAALAHYCTGARFCIGNDSGPVFLAAKTGAKTVMVMGPDTNPAMSAPIGAQASYLKVPDLGALTAQKVYDKLISLKG